MNKEELGKEFLNHINRNYNTIKLSLKKQFRKQFCEDAISDSILKVYDKIVGSGFIFQKSVFSGDSFVNFLYRTYWNEIMNTTSGELLYQKKKDKNIDFDDEYCLPDLLCTDESNELEKQNERLFEDYIIDEIFDYSERNFTPLEVGCFKMYYKNKLSLKQISDITKYDKTFIWINVNNVRNGVLREFQNIKLPNREKKIKNKKQKKNDTINGKRIKSRNKKNVQEKINGIGNK